MTQRLRARPDETAPASPRSELDTLQLLEAWERVAERADRPMTADDRDVLTEARARSMPARELYGWHTTPIPRVGPAHLRRLMGVLAAPDHDALALVIDLEELAAETGRSRRSVSRDLAELEGLAWASRLPLWRGAVDAERERTASAIVVRPLECAWDRCPRIFLRAVYAPLVAAVYTAAYQGDPWIELDGERVGRSQRTFWRYVQLLEHADMLEVKRGPGRRNRYRAGPALMDAVASVERGMRRDHRRREYLAHWRRARVSTPLRSHRSWLELRDVTNNCAPEQNDSLAPNGNHKRYLRKQSSVQSSSSAGPGPPPATAARGPPERLGNMAKRTGEGRTSPETAGSPKRPDRGDAGALRAPEDLAARLPDLAQIAAEAYRRWFPQC